MSVQSPPGQSAQSFGSLDSGSNGGIDSLEPSDERSRYSAFVLGMKILLPALAVILMISVFVSSTTFNSRPDIPVTFREVSRLNDDLRMVSPRITGVDKSGRPYVVTADTATQEVDNPNQIFLENIEADLMLDEGGNWLSVTSRFGTLQTEAETLNLREDISVFSANGYEFHAQSADMDFRAGSLTSDEPVYGQGPVGTLNANGVETSNNGEKIVFTGGVRVVVYYKAG
ncbi:LPS export ABC transporter periplasmic protein LptC [Parvibaculaceae bacterium PLY_AMNH_Bact1]|nr:LPS export ABC transporter periplasmic protein LptC [Parvibaculaceae bacterium PLY_AMNH_Bact1]